MKLKLPPKKEPKTQYSFRISKELRAVLKQAAKLHKRSETAIIESALMRFLFKND